MCSAAGSPGSSPLRRTRRPRLPCDRVHVDGALFAHYFFDGNQSEDAHNKGGWSAWDDDWNDGLYD